MLHSSTRLLLTQAWSCRKPIDLDDDPEGQLHTAHEEQELDTAVLSLYWGWDLAGPRGLLERVFGALQIPDRSWNGLKQVNLCLPGSEPGGACLQKHVAVGSEPTLIWGHATQ